MSRVLVTSYHKTLPFLLSDDRTFSCYFIPVRELLPATFRLRAFLIVNHSLKISLMNSSRSIEGYEDLITKLQTLITAYPPEFIFVHDQTTPRISFPVIRHCVESLHPPVELNVTSAFVDAVTCFTPRLFYDTVINALAKWTPRWEDGCKNWQGPSGSTSSRFNDSFDSFIHGLQALRAVVQNGPDPSGNRASTNGKGKSKAELRSENEYRILVFIERAERLKETLPDLVVPLVRLAELVSVAAFPVVLLLRDPLQ